MEYDRSRHHTSDGSEHSIERRTAVTMKCKGALCLFVLLVLLAGSIFTSSHSRSISPAAEALHSRSAHSFLSAHSLTLPMMGEIAPRLLEAAPVTQPRPTFLPNNLSIHHLIGVGSSQPLFFISQNAQLFANALLLPVIACTLGLSSLMLRE